MQSILFADDTTLYGHSKNLKFLKTKIVNNSKLLQHWFYSNKLTLNMSKTQLMVLENKANTDPISITVNGITLHEAQKTKFLGIWIDSKLSWTCHIAHMLSKIASSIYVAYKKCGHVVRPCLTTQLAEQN